VKTHKKIHLESISIKTQLFFSPDAILTLLLDQNNGKTIVEPTCQPFFFLHSSDNLHDATCASSPANFTIPALMDLEALNAGDELEQLAPVGVEVEQSHLISRGLTLMSHHTRSLGARTGSRSQLTSGKACWAGGYE